MPHLLLIVEPLGQREARGVEAGQAAYQQMLDFTEELRREGALMASSALATAATRLQRPPGAAARVLDGPFALQLRLEAGMGIVANNVLHDRSAFDDDPAAPRLLYRARYLDRVMAADAACRTG